MTAIKDIYNYIDQIAPYSLQMGYDNSGINVLCGDKPLRKAVIALDATLEVAAEAESIGAELVITHHPVIFHGLKALEEKDPAARLFRAGISAISAHTNFDSAVLNDVLCKKLGLAPTQPLTEEEGAPIGYICSCEEISAPDLAKRIKYALGCTVVRYNDTGKAIKIAAVCSGSGGDFLNDALSKKADCLITGDVKHNEFIDAQNSGITLFDAGHFHTENIFCEYMREQLTAKFTDTEFIIAQSGRDILSYEI